MTGTTRRPRFDAAVSGIGLVTPAGIGVRDNWRQICSGESVAAPDPALDGAAVTCRVPGFNPDALLGQRLAWRLDRFIQLALVACRTAVADAGLDPATWDGARVAVVAGNSLGGSTTVEREHESLISDGPESVSPLMIPKSMVNMVAGYIAIDCRAQGPSLVAATACASGTTAVGLGRELLRARLCDVVLAGGTESGLSRAVVAGLARMGALSRNQAEPSTASRPFDVDRDGFVPGEAAAFLVLERVEDAMARRHPIHARVSGYGAATDAYHVTAPQPEGLGIERAARAALDDAAAASRDIQHVNAHGTSTPLNDLTEGRALSRVFPHRPPVTSTKGVTGHTLAAAGAVEAAYTALTIKNQTIPPTANLKTLDPGIDLDVVRGAPRSGPITAAMSTSLGFGGHNAALVLTPA